MKINLEYESNTISVNIEPYQTIKHLKEIITKLFYPMNFEPRLLYFTKDISEDENLILGDIFKNKNTVLIKIKQPLENKEKNSKRELVKEDISEKKSFLSIDKNNTVKSAIAITQNTDINYCICGNSKCNFYCFTCKEFFCNSCKFKHNISHKSIKIDNENIAESIKLYSISLQSELIKNLKIVREFDDLAQRNVFIDIQSRKEMVVRKLNDLEVLFESKMKLFQNQNSYETYEDISNKVNKDIEKIVEGLTFDMLNKKKGINLEKGKKYFDAIFIKQKIVDEMSEEVKSYGVNYIYSKRMDDMYTAIEKLIDTIVNDLNLLQKKRNSYFSATDALNKLLNETKDYSMDKSYKSDPLEGIEKYNDKRSLFSNRRLIKIDVNCTNKETNKTHELRESSDEIFNRKLVSAGSKADTLSAIPFDSSTGFEINTNYNNKQTPNKPVNNLGVSKWFELKNC